MSRTKMEWWRVYWTYPDSGRETFSVVYYSKSAAQDWATDLKEAGMVNVRVELEDVGFIK